MSGPSKEPLTKDQGPNYGETWNDRMGIEQPTSKTIADELREWFYPATDEFPQDKVALRAADEIERLQRQVEAARKILQPLHDCDPDIREWLGMPRWIKPN